MAEPTGQSVGRYVLYDQIASGGMATVHMGRLIGPAGFSRVVAIKRLHTAYTQDPGFASMLLDEARLASRVRHPNVVPILDVVTAENDLLLVMEYVQGETLARLLRAAKKAGSPMAPEIGVAVVIDILRGLHAAHEAHGAGGEPLGIVHRDVSPQNIMVATDGSARLLDFGVAKAASRSQSTGDGQLKGKLGYVAPEQVSGGEVDRRVDIFAAAIVLWECIAGRRLFEADDLVGAIARVLELEAPSLRESGFDVPEALDLAIARGLKKDPDARFQTAEDMAREIEAALRPAAREEVRAWVERYAGDALARRQDMMHRIESGEVDTGDLQVPVEVSPDQSGRLPSLRASVMTPEGASAEDPSTLHSKTRSILPAEPSPKRWRAGTFLVLGALVIGVLVTALMTGRGGAPPSPTPGSAQPASTGAPRESAESASAPRAVQSAPSAEPPDAAPATELADRAPAAQSSAKPRPAHAGTRPSVTPAAGKPTGQPTAPPPPPVDPLLDQR